jgi:hypothetical protein
MPKKAIGLASNCKTVRSSRLHYAGLAFSNSRDFWRSWYLYIYVAACLLEGAIEMKESPAIDVYRHELDSTPNKLEYSANLLKGSLSWWPRAFIKLTGNGTIAGMAQERLERLYGVPRDKIATDQIYDRIYQDKISVSIVYVPQRPGTRSVWVEFVPDLIGAAPIKVEFEVSPDGAFVEEVKTQLDLLKKEIKSRARLGVQKIKFGTKVEGIAIFDREVSDKIKEAIKAKIKSVFAMDIRLPAMHKAITVEFYGALFSKFSEHSPTKHGFEGGLMFEIPFDVF